jgi:type I restriction enzyme R subunit
MTRAPILFRGFDERGGVRIYNHGILPHWRQTGCTYFATFRLADSIPKRVLEELEYERTKWLAARGIHVQDPKWKHRFAKLPRAERSLYERLVGRLLNESLDECHGSCGLRDSLIASEVATALDHFHADRVMTGDFVVMPNHVHVLMTPLDGFELEDILHSIKSFTANKINRLDKRTGQFWQRESYDHIVRDIEQLQAYKAYIAANPSKAKLTAGEYILSQAKYQVLR